MKKTFSITVCALLLSACASNDPASVSMTQYSDYNCKQIAAEMKRVSNKIEQASANEQTATLVNTAVAAFAVSQGQGFYMDENVELKRLHNQYDVLEQTSIKKSCNL